MDTTGELHEQTATQKKHLQPKRTLPGSAKERSIAGKKVKSKRKYPLVGRGKKKKGGVDVRKGPCERKINPLLLLGGERKRWYP